MMKEELLYTIMDQIKPRAHNLEYLLTELTLSVKKGKKFISRYALQDYFHVDRLKTFSRRLHSFQLCLPLEEQFVSDKQVLKLEDLVQFLVFYVSIFKRPFFFIPSERKDNDE